MRHNPNPHPNPNSGPNPYLILTLRSPDPDDLTLSLTLILTSCGQQQAMRGMLMKEGTSATKEQKEGWKAFKGRPSQHK